MRREKHKKNEWEPIFTREGFSYFIAHLAFEGFTVDMKKKIGWGYRDQLIISQKDILTVFGSKEDIVSFIDFTNNKETIFFKKINYLINNELKNAQKNIEEVKKILKRKNLDNKELKKIVSIFYINYRNLYSVYRFPTLFDSFYRGKNRSMAINNFAKTKTKCGYFFTQTDRTVLESIKKYLANFFKIDSKLVLFMNYHEIIDSLDKQKTTIVVNDLKKRYNFYTLMANNLKIKIYTNRSILKNLNLNSFNQKSTETITGQVAYKGQVRGRVVLINSLSEFKKNKSGSILITPMTTIKYIPFLKKYSAIITNEGGITCHAAIISRELKKPCIVGTKVATKVFKNNDLVEVNAIDGTIRKIQ